MSFEKETSKTRESIAEHRPAFDTPFVTINFISTNPEGIEVATRYVMRRREGFDSLPFTDEQRGHAKLEMQNEVAFVLKRKGLFTDEMKKEKDPERLWELMCKAIEVNNIDLTEELVYKLAISDQELMENTLRVNVKSIPYPMYVVGSSPDQSKESQKFTSIAAVAGALITQDNKLIV